MELGHQLPGGNLYHFTPMTGVMEANIRHGTYGIWIFVKLFLEYGYWRVLFFWGVPKDRIKAPFFQVFDICPGLYHQDVPPHKPSLSDSPCDSEIETTLLNSSPLYSTNVR